MRRLIFGLVAAVSVAIAACAASEVAKDAYTVQSKACLKASDTPSTQRACLQKVRDKWTEAGAQPATTIAEPFDGGKTVLQ